MICLDSGCLSYDRLWLTSSLRGNLVASLRVDVHHRGRSTAAPPVEVSCPPRSASLRTTVPPASRTRTTGDIPTARAAWGRACPADHRAYAAARPRHWSSRNTALPTVWTASASPVGTAAERSHRPGPGRPPSRSPAWTELPAVRDGGQHVSRPFTTAKISLRLPPDVDAQAAADALISALTTDEGAHLTIDLEGAADGMARPAARRRATPPPSTGLSHGRVPVDPVGYHGEGGATPFLADLKRSFPRRPSSWPPASSVRTPTPTAPTSSCTYPWARP